MDTIGHMLIQHVHTYDHKQNKIRHEVTLVSTFNELKISKKAFHTAQIFKLDSFTT